MARYSKIGVQVWGDEKFQGLSRPRPSAQFLWFYLLTNPARTALPGLFVSGERTLAEGIEWPLAAFRKHWGEIAAQKMAFADWRGRLVWIPRMINWDPPNGPNVAKAWGRVLRQMPECHLRSQAEAYDDAFLKGISDAMHKAFRDGMGDVPAISDNRLPTTDNRQPPPPPEPSPMPSPPGPGSETGKTTGGPTGDPEHEFFLAYRRKTRELMDRYGSANFHEPKVQAELAAWERDWRAAHGLGPRDLEESA